MVRDLAEFKKRNLDERVGRDAIAREVSRVVDEPMQVVRRVLDQALLTMQDALEAGKRIELRGFASFVAHRKNPRRSYVPTKGKVVRVEARWTVTMKLSKELKRGLMEHLEG